MNNKKDYNSFYNDNDNIHNDDKNNHKKVIIIKKCNTDCATNFF